MLRYCPITHCGGTLRKDYGEVSCTNGHDGARLMDALNGTTPWPAPAVETETQLCAEGHPMKQRKGGNEGWYCQHCAQRYNNHGQGSHMPQLAPDRPHDVHAAYVAESMRQRKGGVGR